MNKKKTYQVTAKIVFVSDSPEKAKEIVNGLKRVLRPAKEHMGYAPIPDITGDESCSVFFQEVSGPSRDQSVSHDSDDGFEPISLLG